MKCTFDDGHKAIAKVESDDGNYLTPICILHLLSFISPNQSEQIKLDKIHMLSKLPLPEAPKIDSKHTWERKYLTGIRGPWECTTCKLRINAGAWAPSDYAFGGCLGKPFDWDKYGVKKA